MSLVPKVHQNLIDPIWTPLGGSRGSKLPKNDKIVFFWAHYIEPIMCDNYQGFYVFSYTKLKIFLKFHIAEITEKLL